MLTNKTEFVGSYFLSCIAIISLCSLLQQPLGAQSYLCDNSLRYQNYTISKVDTLLDVFYRSAESLGGRERNLTMDIFLPANDPITSRPAILLAHGGGFVAGRKEALHRHCLEFARRAYVCASISYRLIDTLVTTEEDYLEGAMRAVMDLAHAVQFIRANAQANNDFNIDPDLIFVGGFSAGAIAALHVNFLDSDELNEYQLSNVLSKEWSNLRHSDISYRPNGALSFAGALLDSSWIDEDDPPLLSYHNTGDIVVPCDKGVSKRSISQTPVYGACFIHKKLNRYPDYMHRSRIFEQGGHMNFLGHIPTQQFYGEISSFAKSIICKHYEQLEKTEKIIDVDYQPNPGRNTLRMRLKLSDDEPFTCRVVRPDGRILYEKQYNHSQQILLPMLNLECKSIYYVQLISASDQSLGRIMILR